MDNSAGRSPIRLTVPVMTDWQVPGYDDLRLLGFGSAGEVWSARERSSGAPVALRRIVGADTDAVAQVRAAATVLRSLPSPHLIRVGTTLRSGGDDVVVLDLADGGPLGSLVAHRGPLSPGEVVTAVAPLAEALGQAHAHGLRHGRLGLSSVLLTAAGMPLLDGLGIVALHDPADGLDPTGGLGEGADVWALGELCRLLLTGDPEASVPTTTPLRLRLAVEAALGPDPRTRPGAADLAAALLASCPALPLDGRRATPRTAPPRRPQHIAVRRPSSRVLAGGAAALVLMLVAVIGWAWGGRTERPTELVSGMPVGPVGPANGQPAGLAAPGVPVGRTTTPPAAPTAPGADPTTARPTQPGVGGRSVSPTAGRPTRPVVGGPGVAPSAWPVRLDPPVDARQVVDGVDAARAAAFAAAQPRGLLAVYAPGSPQQVPDAAAVSALARLRRTAVGVRHEVRSVRVRGHSRDRLDLDVVESLRAYEIQDVSGAVIARAAAGPELHVEMLLRRVAAGWRVEQVRAAKT